MSGTQASDNHCEFCRKTFIRESALKKHSCDTMRRWRERDNVPNRIAYHAWLDFYRTNFPVNKNTEYRDFIESSFYTAFVRWGNYCVEVRAVNPTEFARYLARQNVRVDKWGSDQSYTPYLIAYLRSENHLDAVRRSIKSMMDECDEQSIQLADYFRYMNANKICGAITRGHVSPWLIYNCDSGVEFLGKLNIDQIGVINDYIDPTVWSIKFKRYSDEAQEVKNLVREIGGI